LFTVGRFLLSIVNPCGREPQRNRKVEKFDMIENKRGRKMDGWWLILIIALWFALQAFILPKMGIST
jgi:hypothetical protein